MTVEATRVVGRVIAFESGKSAAPVGPRGMLSAVFMVVDKNDGFDFEGVDNALKLLVPAGVVVTEVKRSDADDATTRARILAGLNAGIPLVNYVGHGSVDLWR